VKNVQVLKILPELRESSGRIAFTAKNLKTSGFQSFEVFKEQGRHHREKLINRWMQLRVINYTVSARRRRIEGDDATRTARETDKNRASFIKNRA
jgi:hypothetical protein